MALTFSDDDGRTMRALQAELVGVLLRANDDKVEAAIAVFALIRCARTLLDRYPSNARQPLLELVVAFLEHADVDEKVLIM